MDLGLQGKRALVTGSTAGIGFAAARALAAEGAQVTINGRTAARVNAAVARLKADRPGASVTGVSADLGTAAGCEVMIQQRPELDMLVKSRRRPAPDITPHHLSTDTPPQARW